VHGGGEGMLRFFADLGWTIVVHDPKPRAHFTKTIRMFRQSSRITWKLGEDWNDALLNNVDIVIKNPGVPLTHLGLLAARNSHIPVTSDADIFTRLIARERIIGVTGTKGKTTTTLLIAHLLGKQAIAVGIPGRPFLDALDSRAKYIVAEYSSFDCDLLSTSPHIAICTSLFPDHLNRYASFAHYTSSKSRLWKFQNTKDIVVAGSTVPASILRNTKRSALRPKSLSKRVQASLPYSVHPESTAIAVHVARLLGVSLDSCLKKLSSYKGAEGRRERVFTTGTCIAFNDTTATNPGSATSSILALTDHFPTSIRIAIVGGEDKSFPDKDIRVMAKALTALNTVYVLPGSFSERLVAVADKRAHIKFVQTMREAVALAKKEAPDGVILLSPGGASFNLYAHEFERGRDFVKEITHTNLRNGSRHSR